MRNSAMIGAVVLLFGMAAHREHQPPPEQPDHFVIGRHTFFDFGPPFHYYELLFVRPNGTGSSVERITLTPAVDACWRPAAIEVASGSIAVSPETLFGKTNPCTIPEKDLLKEQKRCKKCLVFSGANIAMQVQCGTQTRIVRSHILDRDMFDPHAGTPEHTSWTMELLAQLERAVGPSVMDKPMFSMPDEDGAQTPDQNLPALQGISRGEFDVLFQGAPDKPSDLYRAAQIPHGFPSVRLTSSSPSQPIVFSMPPYAPIGKLAHVEGSVSFTAEVDAKGAVVYVSFVSGPPILRKSVETSVYGWKFPEGDFGREFQATLEFALNCPHPVK
jgi:hypothetical protein